MNKRDLVFFITGLIITAWGFISVLLGNQMMAIIAILLMFMIVFVVLILQRRQLAAVQKRTLELLKFANRPAEVVQIDRDKQIDISTKKIINILQAQQIAMERLAQRFDDARESEPTEEVSTAHVMRDDG